jgi:uncharacterized membrane protein YcjF (UPF0283 family)
MPNDTPKLEDHPLNATLSRTPSKKMAQAREAVKVEVETSVSQRTSDEPDEGGVDDVINLTNLADMLVLLVGKWQKAYWMTLACVVLILACIGILVKAGFEIEYLQKNQAELQQQLANIKDEVRKTGDKVDEATDEVKKTSDKVDEAAENAPKVEVDEKTGKARVVIPAKTVPSPKATSRKYQDAGAPPPAPDDPDSPPMMALPPPPPARTSVPLDPQLGIDNDFY